MEKTHNKCENNIKTSGLCGKQVGKEIILLLILEIKDNLTEKHGINIRKTLSFLRELW